MASDPTAPMQRILDFVNTRDVDVDAEVEEQLADPQSLQAWLADHELAPNGLRVTDDDLHRAREIREALRIVLLAHHDAGTDGSHVAAATAALASVPLHLHFTSDSTVTLEAAAEGIDGALGRLLAPIPAAAADGTWQRAKICPDDTCQWAFYDQSRNRSRRWCSMEVCGNREKSRAFRARHSPAD